MPDTCDEFFVGYLPLPARTGRFLRTTSISLVIFIALIAGLVAAMQRDPGTALWDLSRPITIEGAVIVDPYPLFISRDSTENQQVILLVAEGKSGVREIFSPLRGQSVRISGFSLMRKSLMMLELTGEPEILRNTVSPGTVAASNEQEIALRGEIVDPKCFLGAMKPGEGKTHKACATLCIRGGIPPMLIVWEPSSTDGFVPYLLVDPAGAALTGQKLDALLPFVGDIVDVRGTVQRIGNLRLLRIDPSALRRV